MARHSSLQLLASDIVDTATAERTLGMLPLTTSANKNQPTLTFSPERLSGFCAT